MLDATQLRLWKGQRHFLENRTYPEMAVVSGVGYGKSHLLTLKHHDLCLANRRSKLSMVTAPKVDLLLENNVPLYCSLLEHLGYKQGRHYRVTLGQRPVIEYSWGHRVLFRSSGMQAVKKIVSYTGSHFSSDESGQAAETLPVEAAKRIRCPKAVALQKLWYGSPEGVQGFFFRKCNSQATTRVILPDGTETRFSRGNKGEIIVLHGWTEDNKILPAQYIEDMRREFAWNPKLIQAYLYGEFVPLYDNACYDFDPARQKQDGPTWQDRPVYLCWDFNVTQGRAKGVSWTALQEDGPDVHIVAENRGSSRTTWEAVDNFMTQFPKLDWSHKEIVITGDSNGHSRDTRSYGNDYDIILQKLRSNGYNLVHCKAPRGNPSQALRITSVNRLCSKEWHQRLLVRPKCTKTIDSLLQTTIGKNGQIIKSSGETHTDYADTVGYGAVLLRPIKLKPDMAGIDFNWA